MRLNRLYNFKTTDIIIPVGIKLNTYKITVWIAKKPKRREMYHKACHVYKITVFP